MESDKVIHRLWITLGVMRRSPLVQYLLNVWHQQPRGAGGRISSTRLLRLCLNKARAAHVVHPLIDDMRHKPSILSILFSSLA